MNKLFYSLLLGLFIPFTIPASAQQTDSVVAVPQLWGGLELLHWLRNGSGNTYIVPEAALKYKWGKYGGFSLFTGYQVVKKDSLFKNISYTSKGWFLKAGPEVHFSISADDEVFFLLGGHLAYSRFAEEALIRFGYDPEEFELEIDPGNVFLLRGKDRSQTWALGLRQELWIKEERFSFLFSTHIDFLLNDPENNLMPVHYIPGVGIRTPEYYFLSRNDELISKDAFVSFRIHFFYKLF